MNKEENKINRIEIMDSEGLYISIPRDLKHIKYTRKIIELIE